MSRLFTLLVLLVWIATSAQEGEFKWQHPLPHGNDLEGCCCVGDRHAWAVGAAGTIMKSTDKGMTWTLQHSGTIKLLNSVSFTDTVHGWVCGENGMILHTCDGGVSWQQQASPYAGDLYEIKFVDPANGWTVGGIGHILHTSDGGQNWTEQDSNTPYALWSVSFTDSLNGYACGTYGAIVKTSDGGATWEAPVSFSDDYRFRSVFFINPDTGWMSGLVYDWVFSNTVVLKTTDAGMTWECDTLPTLGAPYDLYFTDAMHGYMAGTYTRISQTHDGGETWNDKIWGEHHTLRSLAFFTDNTAISVGWDAQVLRKIGTTFHTWKLNDIGPTTYISDLAFTDTLCGWAVGGDDLILRTSNGGQEWIEAPSGLSPYYSWLSVSFPDAQHGWVSGIWGKVICTRDGGLTWQEQVTHTSENINKVFFLDENYGWAVGLNDVQMVTTNGGDTWTTWFGNPASELNDIFFVDHQNGWVVGYDGEIRRSVNGGLNYTLQNSGTDENLNGVCFADALTGWAVGDNGVIIHTYNSGLSWQPQVSGVEANLEDVQFLDSQEGWISGGGGTLLHTTNGGADWELIPKITINALGSLEFPDAEHGWVCGTNGTILAFKPNLPVGINEPGNQGNIVGEKISILPNPCLSGTDIRLCPGTYDKLSIYDLRGSLVRSIYRKTDPVTGQSLTIDLEPGLYIIQATRKGAAFTSKLVVL